MHTSSIGLKTTIYGAGAVLCAALAYAFVTPPVTAWDVLGMGILVVPTTAALSGILIDRMVLRAEAF